MKITIHRGTKEIGGSCVELQSDNTRILIDFGIPLVDKDGERFNSRILEGKSVEELVEKDILPDIPELYSTGEGIDGILISHSHLDHYGFIQYVAPNIPIYVSQGAKELIDVSRIFIGQKIKSKSLKVIKNFRKFKLGDIEITPYLVDHSAFDALAFLIEGEGKRIFYSGDFRACGNKSVLFERMVNDPPKDIDVLLMEGTMMGRGKGLYSSEKDVCQEITKELQNNENVTFLFSSGQNIDRIVSAYKACRKTDSIFVIDLYEAFILEKLKKVSSKLPKVNWRNIRIKYWKDHADKMADAGYSGLLYAFNKRKIDFFEINRKKNRILMLARDNSLFKITLKEIDEVEGATIIYSMWEGYLTDEFIRKSKTRDLRIIKIHTSGHANIDDLKTFAEALKPKKIIPIHTFNPEKYKEYFGDRIVQLEDKEVLNI